MNNEAVMLPYTVTIAGPERRDYAKPWTYVLHARNAFDAAMLAGAHAGRDLNTVDLKFIDIVPGVPPKNCGYAWNDVRGVRGYDTNDT